MKTSIGTMGILCVALMACGGCSSQAQAPNRAEQSSAGNAGLSTTSTQNRIVEGEGWRGFKVGATRADLIKALGQPDSDSDNRWLKWKKYSVHCLIDDAHGAFELRFDEGFQGGTTSGISIGSPLKEAVTAYGEPSSKVDTGVAKKLIWSSKGILIWFSADKVTQMVVFPKK